MPGPISRELRQAALRAEAEGVPFEAFRGETLAWLDQIEKAKTKQRVKPIPRERRSTRKARQAIRAAAKKYLAAYGHALAEFYRAQEEVAKAAGDGPPKPDGSLGESLRPELERIAKEGAELAVQQVGADLSAVLDQVHERAVDWATRHAAKLVANIDATTEAEIARLVASSLEQGTSNQELADEIESSFWFSESRAESIARTETAYADVQGNLLGWRASGVVSARKWLVGTDEGANAPCEDCLAYDQQLVAIGEDFPEGDPPLHPRCRCSLIPVLTDEESTSDAE